MYQSTCDDALVLFHRCVGRISDYAIQRPDGRYRRAGRPLTLETVQDHVNGKYTIGTYLLEADGSCSFVVFDDDRPDGLSHLAAVSDRLCDDGVPSSLEHSRRGGHLWVFLSAPAPAWVVRSWLLPYASSEMEFYPKQEVTEAYGSLIRVPLGVHRRSGRRYPFVSRQRGRFEPVAPTLAGTLQWLSQVERATVPQERMVGTRSIPRPQPHTQSLTFPRAVSSRGRFSSGTIAQWCEAHDPLEVIGHYVELDRRGMGCCPFGQHHRSGRDTHPSLHVYRPKTAGGSCWYCYTWRQGGSLFDFLLLWTGLDAKTLWARLRAGESF